MKLLLYALLWGTLLAFPCMALSGAWQAVIGRMAEWLLALFRQSVSIDEVQVMAPFDIGLFVALCLATYRSSWRERHRAILIGMPVMIGVEVVVVALGIVPTLVVGGAGDPDSGPARLGAYTIESVPWVSALMVWVAMLGGRHIQPALEAGSRAAAAASRAGAGPRRPPRA